MEETAWDSYVSSERRRELVFFVLPWAPWVLGLGEVRSTGVVAPKLPSKESLSSAAWVPLVTASVRARLSGLNNLVV